VLLKLKLVLCFQLYEEYAIFWPALPTQPAAKSSGSQMYQGKLVIDKKKQNVSTVALEVGYTVPSQI